MSHPSSPDGWLLLRWAPSAGLGLDRPGEPGLGPQRLNSKTRVGAADGEIEGMVRAAPITYAHKEIRFHAVASALSECSLSAPPLEVDALHGLSVALQPPGMSGRAAKVPAMITF